jgi:hypothetical protein
METHRGARVRRPAASQAALRACLALLLLLLPVLDVHAESTLEPIAPGTPIATDAVHPGAAAHVESSGTRVTPRCPACDLAQQSAGTLTQAWLPAPIQGGTRGIASTPRSRPATPFAPAPLRGPPAP